MSKETALLDIWGDYAFFRRGYTTTSPLTYPFPTRTALSGLISAILGLERDSYYDTFSERNSAFALQIISPIRKIRIKQNLIDTNTGFYLWNNKGQRAQIPFEYIKEPKYRVYVSLEGKLFDRLVSLLKEHESVYTPYLGISECIANFRYIGTFEANEQNTDGREMEISSLIPNDKATRIKLEAGKRYGKITVPGFMDKTRVVRKFLSFIYEENGKTIEITRGKFFQIKGSDTNVIFF
jgi:CRISPR-associated protein Cas5h